MENEHPEGRVLSAGAAIGKKFGPHRSSLAMTGVDSLMGQNRGAVLAPPA